jgi:type II secretory pathway pseudopilin PulG
MNFEDQNLEPIEIPETGRQTGYTLLEILGVTVLSLIVIMMAQGMVHSYKKYSTEEIAVQRLKELAKFEHEYRYSNDLTVNPEGKYGNFFDLQNAGLVPAVYTQSDERRHTIDAYVPNYRLEFMRSREETDLEPDEYRYMIMAIPLYNSMGLKTYYMQEDGEVFFEDFLWLQPR